MIREKGETPAFVYGDFCDGLPLIAGRDPIITEDAQLLAANDARAIFLNLPTYRFDLRFQQRAFLNCNVVEEGWEHSLIMGFSGAGGQYLVRTSVIA
jgi:hypothetical protein